MRKNFVSPIHNGIRRNESKTRRNRDKNKQGRRYRGSPAVISAALCVRRKRGNPSRNFPRIPAYFEAPIAPIPHRYFARYCVGDNPVHCLNCREKYFSSEYPHSSATA